MLNARLRHDSLAETIKGPYTADVVHRRGPWLLSSVGDITLAEAEATYIASMVEPATVAA